MLGKDGFIYDICERRFVKFNLTDHNVAYIDREFDVSVGWYFWTEVMLAEDRTIYAANNYGQILRIDTAQNDLKNIGIILSRIYA